MKKKKKSGYATIQVSQEVYDHIRKNAEPLVDSVDSVLRRLLKLPERKRK